MHTEITKMVVVNMDEITAEVELFDGEAVKIELFQRIHDFDSWQDLSIKVAECINKINGYNNESNDA